MEGITPNLGQNLEAQELAVEHASKLVFLSFRFSQTIGGIQKDIFRWIHVAFPSYKLSEGTLAEVKIKVLQMSKDFIFKSDGRHVDKSKGQELNANFIQSQAYSYSQKLADYLNDNTIISPDQQKDILMDITRLIIGRDHNYLISKKGRPSAKNRFASQIVTYAFKHKPTGSIEYDKMFREIGGLITKEKENLSKGIPSRLPLGMLREIEKTHQDH